MNVININLNMIRFLLKFFTPLEQGCIDEPTASMQNLRLNSFLLLNAFIALRSTLSKPRSIPFSSRNSEDSCERFRNLPAAGRTAQGYAAASGTGVTALSEQAAAFASRSCLHRRDDQPVRRSESRRLWKRRAGIPMNSRGFERSRRNSR